MDENVMDCKYDPNRLCPLQEPKCECCSIRCDWEREIRNEED